MKEYFLRRDPGFKFLNVLQVLLGAAVLAVLVENPVSIYFPHTQAQMQLSYKNLHIWFQVRMRMFIDYVCACVKCD